MVKSTLIRTTAAILGVVAAAFGAYTLVAGADSAPGPPTTPTTASGALTSAYSVLGRPREASDTPPEAAAPSTLAGDVPAARLAATSAAGAKVYAIPDSGGGVCVLAVDGSSSNAGCTARDAPTAGAIMTSACVPGLAPGEARVVILLPNDATDVQAVGPGQGALSPKNNIVVLEGSLVPTSITWTTSQGEKTSMPVPGAESIPTNCARGIPDPADLGSG